MRIAVNTRFLLAGRLEGMGWYTHEVMRRMVAKHPEDEFVFLFDRPYNTSFLYENNVHPEVLFPPARHPVLWYLWFEWAVPRVLKRYRPDVFFSPDSFLSLRTNIPTLLTVHDIIPLQEPYAVPWAPRYYYQYFLPRYIRRATRIATVSEYVRRMLVERLNIPPERVSVVYNGYRDGFRPLTPAEQQAVRTMYSDGQPYFLYTGAVHPRKNIPRLIAAFDAFKTQTGAPVRLLLAGRMMWRGQEVKDALQKARCRADIRVLGYVPEAELTRLCGAALALVNVSLNEGFGLPIVEAFASEVPVLCSDSTALAEVGGDAALLVNPESMEAIAVGLSALYRDAALRETLVSKGRLQRQKFRWDTAAEQLYRLIQDTAGG
jgi:glycosyltransferase involved in cell wall biosynthesis